MSIRETTHAQSHSALAQRAGRPCAAFAGVTLFLLAALCHADPRESLGAGDTVRVTVFQNPDLTTEARISRLGTIVVPLIGEVALSGQTPAGAGAVIAERLKQGEYIRNPQVNVSVIQVRSRQVSVLGQVARPGRYALDDTSSRVTDILALAGGIAPDGNHVVTVTGQRDGKLTQREIDLAPLYRGGAVPSNLEVENGDTVFVPRAPVFYIYGEVQRAGAYRLEPDMLVMHALSLGGGLTPRGTARGLRIHRRTADGAVQELDAELTDTLRPDDVVYVRESLF